MIANVEEPGIATSSLSDVKCGVKRGTAECSIQRGALGANQMAAYVSESLLLYLLDICEVLSEAASQHQA
jgi:hypothetical protein